MWNILTLEEILTVKYVLSNVIPFYKQKIWLEKSQKPDALGKNEGQIQIQNKKLLGKRHISSNDHIGHFCWPVLSNERSILLLDSWIGQYSKTF